jgi:hypothetical protein
LGAYVATRGISDNEDKSPVALQPRQFDRGASSVRASSRRKGAELLEDLVTKIDEGVFGYARVDDLFRHLQDIEDLLRGTESVSSSQKDDCFHALDRALVGADDADPLRAKLDELARLFESSDNER